MGIALLDRRLVRASHGGASAAHLVSLVVAASGLVGFSQFGRSVERAVAGEVASQAPSSVDGLSVQSGLGRLLAYADRIPEIRIRPIELEPLPRPQLFVQERRLAPVHVRKAREIAHRLWVEDLTEGRVRSGLVRNPDTGFASLEIGKRRIDVGPVPQFRDPESFRLLASMPEWAAEHGGTLNTQLQGMLERLDDAYDYAFSRGLTGTDPTGRTHFLGPDIERFRENVANAFVPPSGRLVVVHGEPSGFVRPKVGGGAEKVSVDEMRATLEAQGYRRGQPVLLASCSAGACYPQPANAAQQLADALDAPVVAASNTVWGPPSGALVVRGSRHGGFGEWRLYQPRGAEQFPMHARVAVGRAPAVDELGVAATNDLWRLRAGTVERLELAGPWERYLDDNIGAFDAAKRALKPGGRLVIRIDKVKADALARLLERYGFRVVGSKSDRFTMMVAIKQ